MRRFFADIVMTTATHSIETLIAQAQNRGVPLIGEETLFEGFGIRRIW